MNLPKMKENLQYLSLIFLLICLGLQSSFSQADTTVWESDGFNAIVPKLTPSNLHIGTSAGKNATSVNNIFFGHHAGLVSTGNHNIFQGYLSGSNNLSGSFNSFFGYLSGKSNTSGTGNTFLGREAGRSNSTGNYNTAIGWLALNKNVSGTGNLAIGLYAGLNNLGNHNTHLGHSAGRNSTGNFNFNAGYAAGYGVEGESPYANSINIGREAGKVLTSGNYNTNIGYRAGFNLSSGNYNQFLGANAGKATTTGQHNVFIGSSAGLANVEANHNIAIGQNSLDSNNSSNHNIAMGYYSLKNSSGEKNIAIGGFAGHNSDGNGNVFLGYKAGSTETGSHKLYIENTDTDAPLIYGEFDNDLVQINGDAIIGSVSTTLPSSKKVLANASSSGGGTGVSLVGGANDYIGNYFSVDNASQKSWKGGLLYEKKASFGRGILHLCLNNDAFQKDVSIEDAKISIDANGSTINGTIKVTDRIGIPGPLSAWDGDKLVSSTLIEDDGDFGMGTTPVDGYQLAVSGKIKTTEVQVQPSPWPDYVFSPTYQLPPLSEVEKHIADNGHLKNIPSQGEVTKDGIALGEMNAKLLEKIEELTLYLIEQNKTSQTLIEKVKKQEIQISKLEKILKDNSSNKI